MLRVLSKVHVANDPFSFRSFRVKSSNSKVPYLLGLGFRVGFRV